MMHTNKQENHARRQVGLVLALFVLISAATLATGPTRLASAQADAPSWSYTGSLNTARPGHSATLLPNGKVLVVGGHVGNCSANGALASAELYDPSTGTWSFTGSLNGPRVGHTATLLGNGKVLVAGGSANSCRSDPTNTAELYDPTTGEWSFTGNRNVLHTGHTATLLSNGKVLFAGGGLDGVVFATNTAELYDPSTGTWSLTGNLSVPRGGHAATLLQEGKVLVAGGCRDEECPIQVESAEIYDPNTQTWSITGSLNTTRDFNHTLTTLPNGNVLLHGGIGPVSLPINTAELYNPATESWSYTGSLLKRRTAETVTLLPSGQVLGVGGAAVRNPRHVKFFNSAELYDPATGKWNTTASLNTARSAHTATLLGDGKVLVVGGYDGIGHLRSAELYDPEPPIPAPRIIGASVIGKKLIVVGENFDNGAVILINGEQQKTQSDGENPQTTLIGRKAGKKVQPGDGVQVRNPDGTISEAFIFTGS